MSTTTIADPLHLAKLFGVPTRDVALRLRVTPDWVRRLARNPRYARRVRVAALEAILQQEKLALLAESLMAPARPLRGDDDGR
jgi:hypothetical protein